MKKYILLTLAAVISVLSLDAQTIQGYVYDETSREPLVGTVITYLHQGNSVGTYTDVNGFYSIDVPDGGANITFSFLGYESQTLPIIVGARETLDKDVYMKQEVNLLENIVVSAGRFEQKQSEITVSMDIVKKSDIQRQIPTDIGVVLRTLPGVDINDNQPSIRGGNGWTQGIGTRSMMLVDGLSVAGSNTGEIMWNMVPMENIEQVEVIKGASSVLYGSSALNGLINIRTGRSRLVPSTSIKYYAGFYDNPSNSDYIWWDKSLWSEGKYPVKPFLRNSVYSGVRNPMYEGLDFSHSRRIGNFDISGGLNFLTDEGYREQGFRKRFHLGGNVTYHQPSRNIVNYGTNYNYMTDQNGDFLLWRSPKEGYSPSPVSTMARQRNVFSIDPFYNFINLDNNSSHKVKARFMYEGSSIVSGSTKSIVDIFGNMGTDAGAIMDLVNGDFDLGSIINMLPNIADGDWNGAITGIIGVLNGIFPTATTADYMDLIAFAINNGIPTSMSDLVPWLSGALSSENKEKTYVDRVYNYYVDYQFHKDFGGAKITTGTTYNHVMSKSSVTGTHNSDNISVFLQYDQRFFDRLSVSLGVRGEYYRVDDYKREAETHIFGKKVPFKPIFRGGINYQLAEYTFLRASFGQGYRYPSMTEKFAHKDIGGISVYPNYDLKAETGLNAEIGIIRGYKIGRFQGFLDVAAFYTYYKNMIEFDIGFFNNSTFAKIESTGDLIGMLLIGQMPGLGTQFYNVDRAKIYGIDISTNGMVNISPGMKFLYNIGYVYLEPYDPDYKKKNEIEATYTDPLKFKEKSNNSKYLKYRQKHTIKGSIDYEWNRISIGTNITYKSRMLAADYVFVDERPLVDGRYQIMDYVRDLLFGNIDGENLESWWRKTNRDYVVVDLRAGVKVTDKMQLQVMIANLFNKEYAIRPMSIAAPRTFVFTVGYNF